VPDDWRNQLQARLFLESGEREAQRLAVSGVLVPIVATPEGPLVLLTRRAEDLPSHPGQISYPGGRRESGETPQDAALREAREETGLDPADVTVLGHVTDLATHNDDLVCAYVGLVEPPVDLADPITPEEVSQRLLVSLEGLLAGKSRAPEVGSTLGDPYPVRSYEARRVGTPDGPETVHYWHLDEDTALWGISGAVTARLIGRVFDWSPPVDPLDIDDAGELDPRRRPGESEGSS